MDNQQEQEAPIKIIRLNNGEDIIASVVETETAFGNETYMTYVLVEPLKIIYTIKPETGLVSIGLIQWFFGRLTAHDSFEIHPKDVLTIADASKEMIDYYSMTIDQFEEQKAKSSDDDFLAIEETPNLLNALLDKLKDKKKGDLN